MRGLSRSVWTAAIVMIISAGCAAQPERGDFMRVDGGPFVRPPPTPPAGSCTATISGTATFPNGYHPLANALVYVPRGRAVERSGACGQCLSGPSLIARATTDVDGSFRLEGVPLGVAQVVIEKGLFRRSVQIGVNHCGEHALTIEQTRLPARRSEGNVPRIAILNGRYDHMETVLGALGFAELDVYEARTMARGPESGAAFLRNGTAMSGYDYIFINCGSAPEEAFFSDTGRSILSEPPVLDNIRNFVAGGGRFYVTDEAYDYIEQAFPQYLAFSGDGHRGLATTPEWEDQAETGGDSAETVHGQVHDFALKAWLSDIGMLLSDDTAPITELVDRWAMIDRVDSTRVRTWVSGEVTMSPGDLGGEAQIELPLTVTFDYGCGRVLYTSYHTVGEDTGWPRPNQLTAQELVLGYLAAEIGLCIDEPVLY